MSISEESEFWYVREGDEVTGPFSRDEFMARRQRGEFSWAHEVSTDRIHWVSASDLPPSESFEGHGGASGSFSRFGLVLLAFVIVFGLIGGGLWWILGEETQGEEVVAEAVAPEVEEPLPGPPVVPPIPNPGPRPDPPPVLAAQPRSRVIRSSSAVSELSLAVGFVVCTRSYESSDGETTELPFVTGTCFAISGNGYFLTNRHVIEGIAKYQDSDERKAAEKETGMKVKPVIWIFLKTSSKKLSKRSASIVYQTLPEDDLDLAILKVETGPEPLPYYFQLAANGNGDEIKSKEVWSLGFPAAARMSVYQEKDDRASVKRGTKVEELFGESDFEYVAEHGIVNVVRKETGKTRKKVEWILHSARISEGNSGGPLITGDGTVVGINTLVRRFATKDLTNYLAMGMTQINEVLAGFPELARELQTTSNRQPEAVLDTEPKP
jgi:hypothetical protein